MAGNVIELTDDNFQSEVLEANEPVVVDFWAEWCGPCRAMSPIIEELSEIVAGKAKVAKLNVDKAQNVAMNYGISAIPTVIIFKGGEPEKKLVGLTSLQDLQDAVEAMAV
ncbi:MAG: thioredoxin [Phycisphaerae bacterium]|jgi:thioredoxin 1|nr:thioredoxin [Phycisphaerae bacterium]